MRPLRVAQRKHCRARAVILVNTESGYTIVLQHPGDSVYSDEPRSEDDRYVEDSIHGVGAEFASQQKHPLEARMDRFDTDSEAWAALVTDPNLALVSDRYAGADEPTGNLDSERSGEIMDLLIRLNKEHDQAIVMVTHDAGIGQQAHRIVGMRDTDRARPVAGLLAK